MNGRGVFLAALASRMYHIAGNSEQRVRYLFVLY